MENQYYDGTKLLSLKDINGEEPEIYICTSNRTGGKTTYFNRFLVNSFIKGKGKFCLLYRYTYELDDVADKFFNKEIHSLFFPYMQMIQKKICRGLFVELFLGSTDAEPGEYKSCGYAVCLNQSENVKKYSHFFSDVERFLFDEFQSETNHYTSGEVNKFQSIHTSVARGQGKQYRRVPVYMISNPVSTINPYYVALGISNRLDDKTRFLKGDGYVLEQGYVESASNAQRQGAFNRAFQNSEYQAYSNECVYLNDNMAFIEKLSGENNYLCTIRYENHDYGIREYTREGLIYCDSTSDGTNRNKIVIDTPDHNVNFVMLKRNDMFIMQLRMFYEKGCFRFKNLKCKEVIMKAVGYY